MENHATSLYPHGVLVLSEACVSSGLGVELEHSIQIGTPQTLDCYMQIERDCVHVPMMYFLFNEGPLGETALSLHSCRTRGVKSSGWAGKMPNCYRHFKVGVC